MFFKFLQGEKKEKDMSDFSLPEKRLWAHKK